MTSPSNTVKSSSVDELPSSESVDDAAGSNFFPLMRLPLELIVAILGFLSIKDVLRARVNRQLWKIEAAHIKHSFDALVIRDDFKNYRRRRNKRNKILELHLKDADKCDSYLATLRKMATNFTFGQIFVQVKRPEFAEVLKFASTMNSSNLLYNDVNLSNEVFDRSRLEMMVQGRQQLTVYNYLTAVTTEFLLDCFNMIKSGRTALLSVDFHDVRPEVALKTLARLGLHIVDESTWISSEPNLIVESFFSRSSHLRTINSIQGYENYLIRIDEMILIVGKDLLHDFDENKFDYNFGIQRHRAEGLLDYPVWRAMDVWDIQYVPNYTAPEED